MWLTLHANFYDLLSAVKRCWYFINYYRICKLGCINVFAEVFMVSNHENVDIPGLSKLGKRKSWIIFSQFMCLIGIASISFFDPKTNLSIIALLAFYIAFLDLIQDISVTTHTE